MKQIRLIASDFDSLDDYRVFDRQYADIFNCPIARALKRRYPGIKWRVGPSRATDTLAETVIFRFNGSHERVTDCAYRIKHGAKYAIIKAEEA